jgi:peroxiredoxin
MLRNVLSHCRIGSHFWTTSFCAVLMVGALASAVQAGKFNKVVSVGDAAKAWEALPGVDGKSHSLADYKDQKIVVQVFFSNHCYAAQAYEKRLLDLHKDYAERGVQLVFVSSSLEEEDNLEHMKSLAEEKGYKFPYLMDASQEVGRAFGASVTPQVFVLVGEDRKIAYMGAIDNNWDEADTKTDSYLRNALDAVLADKVPEVQETRAKGCGIEYK